MALLPAMLDRRNDATSVNPPNANIYLSSHGSSFLWAWFCVFMVSLLGFVIWSYTRLRPGHRVFHWIATFILMCTTLTYFLMAADLGATPIGVEFHDPSSVTRQIWYVRYVDWALVVPATILLLTLATALPVSEIVWLMFLSLFMIICGLIGALIRSSYKWGLFVFATVVYFWLFAHLWTTGVRGARVLGRQPRRLFLISSIYLFTVFLFYPVAWGLADAGNRITPTGEVVFYGILDLLTKTVWLTIHMSMLDKIDDQIFHLSSGKTTFSRVEEQEARAREKQSEPVLGVDTVPVAVPVGAGIAQPAAAAPQNGALHNRAFGVGQGHAHGHPHSHGRGFFGRSRAAQQQAPREAQEDQTVRTAEPPAQQPVAEEPVQYEQQQALEQQHQHQQQPASA